MTDKQVLLYTARPLANRGHAIIDHCGRVVAWACDGYLALLLMAMLNPDAKEDRRLTEPSPATNVAAQALHAFAVGGTGGPGLNGDAMATGPNRENRMTIMEKVQVESFPPVVAEGLSAGPGPEDEKAWCSAPSRPTAVSTRWEPRCAASTMNWVPRCCASERCPVRRAREVGAVAQELGHQPEAVAPGKDDRGRVRRSRSTPTGDGAEGVQPCGGEEEVSEKQASRLCSGSHRGDLPAYGRHHHAML